MKKNRLTDKCTTVKVPLLMKKFIIRERDGEREREGKNRPSVHFITPETECTESITKKKIPMRPNNFQMPTRKCTHNHDSKDGNMPRHNHKEKNIHDHSEA